MARVPTKHNRDQAPDFEGFLNNLQDWELSFKDKDKKLKSLSSSDKLYTVSTDLSCGLGDNGRSGQSKERGSVTSQTGIVGEDRRGMGKTSTSVGLTSTSRQKDYLGNYDAFGSAFMTEDSSVDANSEKELGNDYFKKKKFKEAIDCYSRSLALSPTAVAYANRAMAYLKIKRFQEAEDDCTEALNLDDRYIKAYSRRSTARKELGKLKGSIEDAEFALRLEPQNQEIKKQYTDAKSMYEKEILQKASGALRDSTQRVQKEGKGVKGIQSVPNSSQMTSVPATQEDCAKATSPVALPQIFKNALSAPLLIDIIRCIATIFNDEVDLAVNYLENLSKVPRFNMIIMCLSSTDKADLQKIWDEIFCSKRTPPEYSEMLYKLRSLYCHKL